MLLVILTYDVIWGSKWRVLAIFDNITKKLVYDRKLKEGSGSSIYGLEVAKAMNLDSEFIDNAYKIRNKLLDKNDRIVENKVSHFNADVILGNCAICKKPTEEVHHISEQHLADNDGIIEKWWQEHGMNNEGNDPDPYEETTPEKCIEYLSKR